MTTFPSEELLVGLVALGAIPWIAWTLQRGLRADRLPIGRTSVGRVERPGVFKALAVFYIGAALLMGYIALNLLAGTFGL